MSLRRRPLKRLVNREVETVLAKKLIDNEIKPDSIVTIDYQKSSDSCQLGKGQAYSFLFLPIKN